MNAFSLRTVSLFPLPNTVFFPKTILPLRVFEPRYRTLVIDALDKKKLIGVPLLKAGYEKNYEGHPPVYSIFGYGEIVNTEKLPDGQFNILLQGLGRARMMVELKTELCYRTVVALCIPEEEKVARNVLTTRLKRIQESFLPLLPVFPQFPKKFREVLFQLNDPEVFCHFAAMHLIEEAEDRQRMLEFNTLDERLKALEEWMGQELLRSVSYTSA